MSDSMQIINRSQLMEMGCFVALKVVSDCAHCRFDQWYVLVLQKHQASKQDNMQIVYRSCLGVPAIPLTQTIATLPTAKPHKRGMVTSQASKLSLKQAHIPKMATCRDHDNTADVQGENKILC